MTVEPLHLRLPARLIRLGRLRNVEPLAYDFAAFVLVVVVGVAVGRTPIGSADYGQWLMVSRFFSGEDVPAYREIWGVAPLVPLVLGVAKLAVQDAYIALNIVRVLLVAGLIVAVYSGGSAIFRSRAAGLLAAVCVVVMTDRFLDLVAFGGLLQLSAMAFLMLTLGATSMAGRHDERERRWWTLAAVAMAFAIYSHAGTAAIVLPAAAVGFALNWPWRQRRAWRDTVSMLGPAAAVATVALVYWLGVLVPANSGYGENPASLSYRGPSRLYHDLTFRTPTLVLLCLGLVSLCYGTARELAERRLAGYTLVSAWALTTFAVLGVALITQTATDYPRFATPILAPMAVAAAGAGADLIGWARAWPGSRRVPGPLLGGAGLALSAAVAVGMGPWVLGLFRDQTQGYRLPDRAALDTSAAWAEANLPDDAVVATADSREGKWIEGLAGNPALFSQPIRYSFRSNTWDRNVAAEALIRSTTAMTNGYLFAKFTLAAEGESELIPHALQLAVNHDGEYIEVLRFPETGARVMAGPSDVLATLGAMDGGTVERLEGPGGISVKTVWTGTRRGHDVVFTRTVTQAAGSRTIDIVDEVETTAPVAEMQLSLARVTGLPFAQVETAGGRAEVEFLETGRREPTLSVTAEGGEPTITRAGETLIVRALGSKRLHVRITAETASTPISSLALLYPPQIQEDYNVAAVLLRQDGAAVERQARLAALGFEVVLEEGPYILLADPRMLEAGR